jgi:broad specificity phosphatase PhoE
MSARLTLISHAATAAVRAAAFPRDESIEAAGRSEALALADRFRTVSTAWVSPGARTVETAAALGLDATIDAALSDLDFGRWAGRTFSDVEAAEPEAMAQWLAEPAAAPHGGESLGVLMARIAKWLDFAAEQRGRIAAVTHPAVIRAAIVIAIEAGPAAFWRIDIAPLTLVELRSNGRRWTLRSIGN